MASVLKTALQQHFRKSQQALREQLQKRKRVIIDLLLISAGITILSITIGRELLFEEQLSLYSFSIIHFTGYLFFILLPVEALLPLYLAKGFSASILILLAIGTAMLAQLIDYSLGHLTSSKIINDLIGEERYRKAEHAIKYYGFWTVFLFNLLPLSSPIAVFAAGMLRMSLGKVMLLSLLGLTLKYLAIVLVYNYFF